MNEMIMDFGLWSRALEVQCVLVVLQGAGTWDENSVSEPLNSREEVEEVEMEELLSTCEEMPRAR